MTDLTKVDLRLALSDVELPDLRGDQAAMIHCPTGRHSDSERSLAVYPDHLHCYGCGWHVGRRMEALAFLLYGSTERWFDAVKVAEKYTTDALDSYRERVTEVVRKVPLPGMLADAYSRILVGGSRDNRMSYLEARGISKPLAREYWIGHTGTEFTIPYFDRFGNLITIRYRRDDAYGTEDVAGRPLPKYRNFPGRGGVFLYNADDIPQDTYELWVFEGEFDALLAARYGFRATTVPNGAQAMKYLPKLLAEHFPQVRPAITVVGDMDDVGNEAANNLVSDLVDGGWVAARASWPLSQGKDLTEQYQRGTDIAAFLRTISPFA